MENPSAAASLIPMAAVTSPLDAIAQKLDIQKQRQQLIQGPLDAKLKGQAIQENALALQQKVQDAADNAAIHQAAQLSAGDPDKMVEILSKSAPSAATKFSSALSTQRKNDAETMKTQLDNAAAQNTQLAQLLTGIKDETTFQAARATLAPPIAAKLGDHYDPAAIQSFIDQGTTLAQHHTDQQDILKAAQDAQRLEYDKGKDAPDVIAKWTQAVGKAISVTGSQQDLDSALAIQKHLGAPADVIAQFGTQWTPDLPQKAKDIVTGPAKDSPADGGFQKFYQQYLADNNLQPRADYEITARKLFSNANTKDGPAPPVDQQELTSYLAKNPGKTAQDYAAWKASLAPAAQQATGAVDPDQVKYWYNQVVNDAGKWNMVPKSIQQSTGPGSLSATLAANGKDINKISEQGRARAQMAKDILPQIPVIESEMQDLDKLGLMGPVGGRWRDLLAGKIGAGDLAGGNATNAQKIGKFVADVGLLKSAVANAHGGARGGGSPAMLEHMNTLLNSDKMDADLFTGGLSAFKEWMQTYSDNLPASGTSAAPAAAPAKTADPLGIR